MQFDLFFYFFGFLLNHTSADRCFWFKNKIIFLLLLFWFRTEVSFAPSYIYKFLTLLFQHRSGIQASEIAQMKNDKFDSKTVAELKVVQKLHSLRLEQIYSYNLIAIWHRMDMNVNVILTKSTARWVSTLILFFSSFVKSYIEWAVIIVWLIL